MTNVKRLTKFKLKQVTKEDKHQMYKRALTRLEDKVLSGNSTDCGQDIVTKIAYIGIKYINTMPRELNETNIEYLEAVMMIVRNMLSLMPFDSLKTNYPIDKTYEKLDVDWKDYHYTVNEFKDWDGNEAIGEKLDDLLWDYQNQMLFQFHVNSTLIMSSKLRMAGKLGIGEKFAQHFQIPLYVDGGDGSFKQVWQKPNLTLIDNN